MLRVYMFLIESELELEMGGQDLEPSLSFGYAASNGRSSEQVIREFWAFEKHDTN